MELGGSGGADLVVVWGLIVGVYGGLLFEVLGFHVVEVDQEGV